MATRGTGVEERGNRGAGAALLDPPVPEARRELVATLNHELRAPLAAIRNYCDILIGCPPADEAARRSFLQAISDEAERLTRLLGDLAEIERLEDGAALIPAPCDLGEMAERAVLAVHPLAALKRVEVGLETEGDPEVVWGEPRELQRALNALVDNAVKFSPVDAQVTVRTCYDAGRHEARVEVEDEGIGIPDDVVPHVFEKFYQAAVPPDPLSPRGSGLGLALARLVARHHQGSIAHRPRPRGSVFTLALPF